MAEEEEQASVEEVAQQQPEEKVALEVKVGKFQFTDGSWYEGEYVVDGAISKRQGKGFLQDGEESYDGNWENDTMNGEGGRKHRGRCTMRSGPDLPRAKAVTRQRIKRRKVIQRWKGADQRRQQSVESCVQARRLPPMMSMLPRAPYRNTIYSY